MLIEYLPPVVGKIREMKEICAAEQPEFDLLAQQVDQILANMFILLANEEGIKRFEEELNITPKTTDTLEDRRLNVLSRASKSKVTTALIMSIISNYSAATELIKDFDKVLSLNLENAKSTETTEGVDAELESFVLAKIEERKEAKKAKDFAKADAIRDELLAKGIVIKDTREGVVWHKAE